VCSSDLDDLLTQLDRSLLIRQWGPNARQKILIHDLSRKTRELKELAGNRDKEGAQSAVIELRRATMQFRDTLDPRK
jgi:hypothetical protein